MPLQLYSVAECPDEELDFDDAGSEEFAAAGELCPDTELEASKDPPSEEELVTALGVATPAPPEARSVAPLGEATEPLAPRPEPPTSWADLES